MRYLLVIVFAALLVLPSFAQSDVDNCCQVGRACATDSEWLDGWSDYQSGQCDAPEMSAASPASATSYTFTGQGKHTTSSFMLTPGKWAYSFRSSGPSWYYSRLAQLDNLGNVVIDEEEKRVGPCLQFPWTRRLGYGSYHAVYISWGPEIIVTKPCTVQLDAYERYDAGGVRDFVWTLAMHRIDTNF